MNEYLIRIIVNQYDRGLNKLNNQETLMKCLLIGKKFNAVSSEVVERIKKKSVLGAILKYGQYRSVVSLQQFKNEPNYLILGLQGACAGDDLIMAYYFILCGANKYNEGLFSACRHGNYELVKLMLDKGADYYDWGLKGAAFGGHLDIVMYMIQRGAKDLNCALNQACNRGHREIAEFLIKNGANDWNYGLYGACKGRQSGMARLMIDKGANLCGNCDIINHLLY